MFLICRGDAHRVAMHVVLPGTLMLEETVFAAGLHQSYRLCSSYGLLVLWTRCLLPSTGPVGGTMTQWVWHESPCARSWRMWRLGQPWATTGRTTTQTCTEQVRPITYYQDTTWSWIHQASLQGQSGIAHGCLLPTWQPCCSPCALKQQAYAEHHRIRGHLPIPHACLQMGGVLGVCATALPSGAPLMGFSRTTGSLHVAGEASGPLSLTHVTLQQV
jgi:hypothetical protein